MSNKIQVKRGLKANLPVLDAGEPAFTTDTKEFFVGDGTSNIEFAKQEDLEVINNQVSDLNFQTAGGTGTSITLTINQTMTNGFAVTFIASANNGGAVTTINGKPLYKPNTTIVPNLIAGKAYTVWYNSTSDCFFIKASAEGNTIAAHVLAGDTFSNDNDTGLMGTLDLSNLVSGNIRSGVTINGVSGKPTVVDTADAVLDPQYLLNGYSGYDDGVKKNGTMPNLSGNWQSAAFKGAYNNGSYYGVLAQIPKGYSDGGTNTYTLCSDSNFVASNIISGKSIFGVAGTATLQSLGGKRYVTGSVISSSSSVTTQTCATGAKLSYFSCVVSGLSFTPSYAIFYTSDNKYITCYINGQVSAMNGANALVYGIWGINSNSSWCYANSTTIAVPVANNKTTFNYIIFE